MKKMITISEQQFSELKNRYKILSEVEVKDENITEENEMVEEGNDEMVEEGSDEMVNELENDETNESWMKTRAGADGKVFEEKDKKLNEAIARYKSILNY